MEWRARGGGGGKDPGKKKKSEGNSICCKGKGKTFVKCQQAERVNNFKGRPGGVIGQKKKRGQTNSGKKKKYVSTGAQKRGLKEKEGPMGKGSIGKTRGG